MTNLITTITEPAYGFSVGELRKGYPSDGRCIYCHKTMLTRREAKAQGRNGDYYTGLEVFRRLSDFEATASLLVLTTDEMLPPELDG